ncbi:MAG: prepilin peptidase [Acidobacteria bacterium]|nr:prepilin peptidase [Acidobacteriota bacterium]
MTKLVLPIAAALASLVIVAAYSDVRTRLIPNALVSAGAIAGVSLNLWLYGWHGLLQSLLGLVVGFAVFLLPFLLQGTGGGDVKLMAAIGSLAGPMNTLVIFVLVAVSGGVMAIGLLLIKGGMLQTFRNVGFILKELAHGRAPHESRPDLSLDSERSVKLPYGVPIAVGTLLFLSL